MKVKENGLAHKQGMDYTVLGRTGLRVSVLGFGCGGPSHVGRKYGKSESESVAVIRAAIDNGINFIDTAEVYETEHLVGKALKETGRERIVVSTKKTLSPSLTARQVVDSLEASLRRLGMDYVDIYHLHGVLPNRYKYCCDEIVPVLCRMRDQGKLRYIGITERLRHDLQHTMLQRALRDDIWDVIMVGYNILNQSAKRTILPLTRKKNVGVLVMFAVRRALSRPERLKEVVTELVDNDLLDGSQLDPDDPLGFLIHAGGAVSVPDAAYRFCRYEPGIHVVLSGTGNMAHLHENIASFSRPPLPEADVTRLQKLFGSIDCVSGN